MNESKFHLINIYFVLPVFQGLFSDWDYKGG